MLSIRRLVGGPRVRRLYILALLSSVLVTTGAFAQQFGGNPPSLKYKQINTDTARIIFPTGLDVQAQQVAEIVHRLSRTTLPTIGAKQHKIDIVFQNQTIIPNGFVQLAPFRSEFQLTPEQNSFDLGSLPWQKMLAIHEYRHVQQYNNFRVGLSGAFYYLFGEGGQALANSLALPNWFWEGDAVFQETLVSDQGRGRLPYFFNGFRSLWAGGKDYSWMKLRNGSLRDYVPNWYPLGYMLVSYGRERYGDGFWRKVTRDAAAFKPLFYPMQGAIRKYSGVSFSQFREDAMEQFRGAVAGSGSVGGAGRSGAVAGEGGGSAGSGASGGASRGSAAADAVDPDAYARAHKHFVADEEFPQLIGRDSLIYMRSSYKRIPAFVIRDLGRGTEKVLVTRAISLDNYFSYHNGKVVYAAYENDARWGWRDYSVIRILDPYTGEDNKITSRSRYFAPDISADGGHIIVVREAASGSCDLLLLNSGTGATEKVIPNTDSLFYTYPKFYTGERILSPVRNTKGQMALALLNIKDGAAEFLTPFSFQTIGMPSVKQDTIWFTASRNGQDRVYGIAGGALSGRGAASDGQGSIAGGSSTSGAQGSLSGTAAGAQGWSLFRVRLPYGDPAEGQYAFHAGNGKYAWSTFTAVGYTLDVCDRAHMQVEPLEAATWDQSIPTQGIDSLSGASAHLLDSIGTGSYPTKPYPALSHLINFHTWRPYINDPDYMFSLVSDNVLNTMETQLFVDYNRNERYTELGVSSTYGALYPWIDAGVNYLFNRNAYTQFGNKVFWNEGQVYGGLSVPLNFTRHLTYTSLQFGSDLVYKKEYFQGTYKDSFNTRGFAYIDPSINFTNQIQQSQMQIYPRLAETISLSYDKAVTLVDGYQFLASGYFYLPGVAYTHSLLLGAAFQDRDLYNTGGFTNNFPFSRGYSAENFYQMYRLAGNYQFPLLYPDWGFGNMIYFLRIRANLYYDYTKVLDYYTNGAPYNGTFRSYGVEMYFDTQWWNQLPISFGIRYSHLLDADPEGRGPNQWELILPLNLLSQGYSGKAATAHVDY